jgi:hypothetical protein
MVSPSYPPFVKGDDRSYFYFKFFTIEMTWLARSPPVSGGVRGGIFGIRQNPIALRLLHFNLEKMAGLKEYIELL